MPCLSDLLLGITRFVTLRISGMYRSEGLGSYSTLLSAANVDLLSNRGNLSGIAQDLTVWFETKKVAIGIDQVAVENLGKG